MTGDFHPSIGGAVLDSGFRGNDGGGGRPAIGGDA